VSTDEVYSRTNATQSYLFNVNETGTQVLLQVFLCGASRCVICQQRSPTLGCYTVTTIKVRCTTRDTEAKLRVTKPRTDDVIQVLDDVIRMHHVLARVCDCRSSISAKGLTDHFR